MRIRVIWLMLALLPTVAAADDSPLGQSYVETRDLKLVYFNSMGYLVPHAVGTFTNSLAWQRQMFGWVPSESTTVLLQDFADAGNAHQSSAPRNRLVFDVSPISHAFETFPATERMNFLMNHEMVHVAAGDVASEEDLRWRRFFLGKVAAQSQNPESLIYSYLTVPRFNSPRWYNEGGAVFLETWMGGGLGRAQGGYDEMVFRAMVRDNAHFYDPLGLASRAIRVNFQVGVNAYLYGTRFFTYLAFVHSPEKVVAWIRRDEGSQRNYADQFQSVFGISLEQSWQAWIAFEHEFQRRNLEEVRKFPITPQHNLAASAIGSMSRMYYDEPAGILYAGIRYPGVVDHIGALNIRDGSVRRLADIEGALLYRVASVAYDPNSGTVFFTKDNLAWRDLMAVDVKTGEVRMLLEDARIGDIVFNPVDRSIMGVRYNNGIALLVRIPYPYTEWYQLHAFPYEDVPYDLDISPDGRLLSASMSEVNGDQFLRVWEMDKILAGDVRPLSEFRFGQSVPESFVFSPDGRYLYGSSYYTGVSNIFRYEVATGAVEAVSNAETGFFRPVPLADGRLLVLAYTAEGFVPATIQPRVLQDVSAITFLGTEVATKYPVVKTWQVPPPSTVDYEKEIIGKGPYIPLRNLALDNAFPVVQGYKNYVGIGYHANIADPLSYANFGITAAYTPTSSLPSDERGHVEITGQYLNWRGALSWNRSDFYDLFGPTKRSRKGYAAKLGYTDYLIYDEPRRLDLIYDVAWYDQIDTLPNAQNVSTNFTRLLTGEVGLHYTDVQRSLGAVDGEKGLTWSAVLVANQVNGQAIPQLRGNFDFGLPLPIPHSSVWLRSSAGIASGDRNNTVANFYFGGFGNNYVDSGPVQRYREYNALPGFEIDEVSGLSFVKELVEWNLPPVVFESIGTQSFHLAWLRPAMFATALWTDPQHASLQKTYENVGAQVDLRFSVLHWYDMTLSVGFAAGFQGSRSAGTEWMLSLKIM
jgi:hypothetical protein